MAGQWLKLLTALSLISLLGACATGEVTPGNANLAPGETFFVLGVRPENIQVHIYPGKVQGGFFYLNEMRSAVVGGTAPDGYIVGKAKAGDVLAITEIVVLKNANNVFGKNLSPCGLAKTIVFQVPADKVIYLTDVGFRPTGDGMSPDFREDLPGARAYLESHYSPFAARLESHVYQLLPTAQPCQR